MDNCQGQLSWTTVMGNCHGQLSWATVTDDFIDDFHGWLHFAIVKLLALAMTNVVLSLANLVTNLQTTFVFQLTSSAPLVPWSPCTQVDYLNSCWTICGGKKI